jgi:hypothetical protein
VYGFADKEKPSTMDVITPTFVALEALAVFLHLACFCGISLVPIFYALAMQDQVYS